MDLPSYNTLQPKVVLGVAAHPDDLDFSAGGTMAAFAQQGAKVYYLILTDGGKGSQDRSMKPEKLSELRRAEQRNAGKVIGLADVFFGDYPDGTLQNTMDVKRDVVRTIREVKPDVVVTMDPSVLYSTERGFINHPDHRAAGQAALDAVFPLARDHMSFPELLAEGYEPHEVRTVLLSNIERNNYAIDITDTLNKKFQILAEHVSQVPPNMEGLKERFTERAAQVGTVYGYQYAEPFMRIDVH